VPLRAAEPLVVWRSWLEDHERIQRDLRRGLPWVQRSVQMPVGRIPMPRLECWFGPRQGVAYVYSGERYESEDVHSWPLLCELRDRVSAQCAHGFDALFANCYRNGRDSIGWHADDEVDALGPARDIVIASLSLGTRRRFCVKRRTDRGTVRVPEERSDLWLGEGDLLLMGRGCQSEYLHQAPKEAGVVGERINLTFRRLA
jgi:alkylated DNA repair dioxygenase AlkB